MNNKQRNKQKRKEKKESVQFLNGPETSRGTYVMNISKESIRIVTLVVIRAKQIKTQ